MFFLNRSLKVPFDREHRSGYHLVGVNRQTKINTKNLELLNLFEEWFAAE
jgi:hypothetical protein